MANENEEEINGDYDSILQIALDVWEREGAPIENHIHGIMQWAHEWADIDDEPVTPQEVAFYAQREAKEAAQAAAKGVTPRKAALAAIDAARAAMEAAQ